MPHLRICYALSRRVMVSRANPLAVTITSWPCKGNYPDALSSARLSSVTCERETRACGRHWLVARRVGSLTFPYIAATDRAVWLLSPSKFTGAPASSNATSSFRLPDLAPPAPQSRQYRQYVSSAPTNTTTRRFATLGPRHVWFLLI